MPRAKSGLNFAIGQFFLIFVFAPTGNFLFSAPRDPIDPVHSPNREQLLHHFPIASQAGRGHRGNNFRVIPVILNLLTIITYCRRRMEL